MRRFLAGIMTALAMFLFVNNAGATPSTQIWIPSTDVQGFLVPHIGWDAYVGAYNNKDATGAIEGGIGNVTNGGITIGVLPFKNLGMEVGIDYRDINGDHTKPIYFNFKLGVPEDAFFKNQPAIAVGGFDFGTAKGATTYDVGYALIAKTFPIVGRISAGGFKGAIGSEPGLFAVASSPKDTDDAGLLVSWDRTLTEISDKLWVAVDYMSGKSGYGALSFGASYAITPDASFILGYDIWNDKDTYKPTVTFQVDMNVPALNTWFKKAAPDTTKK